jgi:ABC-type transport system substrate-binding protein
MSLDRDGLTDLGYQVKKLQAAAIKVRGDWNNIVPAGLLRFWLDPKSPDIGDGGKNFKYDPTAAKALLAAAGIADGAINTTYQYTANAYGATFNSIAEAQIQMINQIGIKTTTDVQDYNAKYKTQTFAGNFKGIAFGYETPFPEAAGYASAYLPGNVNNHSKIDDPQLTDLWKKQSAELDLTKRKALFNQIQQYHATKMYYVPSQAGAGTGWTGYREWLQINNIHSVPGSYGVGTELFPFYWKNQ